MLRYFLYAVRYIRWALGSLIRRRRHPPDYIMLTLEGEYPMLPQPSPNVIMRYVQPPKISIHEIAESMRVVAADPRVRGVVIHLRDLALPLGHLDTLRDLIKELRAANKRVIVWSYSYGAGKYYLASAANEILLCPGGFVETLGLRRRYLFVADALQQLGLKAEFVQITPYKTAGDMYTRNSMSDQARQMGNWLIDAAYNEIIAAIAERRSLDKDAAAALASLTPCTDLVAKEAGIVDGLVAEEDLPAYLKSDIDKAMTLSTLGEAWPSLLQRPPVKPGPYIAVLPVEGSIINGHSRRPPVDFPIPLPLPMFNERAGDLSVVQAARRIAVDKRAAAVVVYIDSPGGSGTASEAMRMALLRIAARKPLVIAMGPVAASGGYWIATPGRHIVAQPNTITGSIGVLAGKIYNSGLLAKLFVNEELISRGNRSLFGDESAFTEEERRKVRSLIERMYDMFLDRVSESRKLSRDVVDAVGGGRVWTGRQALAHGLVDELGGLDQAIAKARALAGLGPRSPLRIFHPGGGGLAPLPSTADALAYALDGLRLFNEAGPLCLLPLTWSTDN